MNKVAKIAISLPKETLDAIEKEREATGESRSELLRRAVEAFLRERRQSEAIERYVRGYREHPETAAEVAAARAMGAAALAEEAWD
ncbi:MAG: ribbon-helix-helix protein, CopG family [Chloroflexi bacterium]|nr:ribbon-helix-helix protein, CopG family [Chloroflexota bacterium]